MAGQHHRLKGPESEQTQEMVEDWEVCHAAVHGVTESWTRRSD